MNSIQYGQAQSSPLEFIEMKTVTYSVLRASMATLAITISSFLPSQAFAQEAPSWALEPCMSEAAKYEVTTTAVLDVITGKGGATLTLAGYNAGGIDVVYVCTYTIDTAEIVIEYQ
jgi:S-adenosylmethionine:diacylglycerol 3-amino-3-carboxypropyl transferase